MVQWVKHLLRIPGNHGSKPEHPPKAEQVYRLLKQGLWAGAGQRQGDPWRSRFCRNSVKTKMGRCLMSTSGLHMCIYSLMCIHMYTLTHTHTKLKGFLRK